MNKTLLDLNLQQFAEDENTEGETGTPKNQQEGVDETYTKDDLDKAVKTATDGLLTQDEVNEIVTSRLKRDRETREEEARLAKLSEDERRDEELKKTNEELEELKAQHAHMILEQDTIKVLSDEGLPIEFKSFLMKDNAETTNENIKVFKEMFDENVQQAVEERLKGRSPNVSAGKPKESDVWEDLRNKYKR